MVYNYYLNGGCIYVQVHMHIQSQCEMMMAVKTGSLVARRITNFGVECAQNASLISACNSIHPF